MHAIEMHLIGVLQVVAHADEGGFLVGSPPAASVNGTATATMKAAHMLGRGDHHDAAVRC